MTDELRRDSPVLGGLTPAEIDRLCAPAPDPEAQRRLEEAASAALAKVLTAWPVLDEGDRLDAIRRWAPVPLSAEAVQIVAKLCAEAMFAAGVAQLALAGLIDLEGLAAHGQENEPS